jgi:hypothetical protein
MNTSQISRKYLLILPAAFELYFCFAAVIVIIIVVVVIKNVTSNYITAVTLVWIVLVIKD